MANADIRQLEMDGRVFYPQTDLNALVNNGAYAIDAEPTQDSSNLVTSDSVYRIKSETLQENREMVNSIMEDYAPVEIQGDVTNAADEEDLTSVNVSGTDVLKFKDKVYNQLVYSGLGRKILRKNMVNGVNTLYQEDINEENTIYVIQYDFVLGEDITVPSNCILEFNGGSISGDGTSKDTITGTNTTIIEAPYAIKDVSLAGDYLNDTFDTITFGIDNLNSSISTSRFQRLLSYCNDTSYRKTIIVNSPVTVNDTLTFIKTSLQCNERITFTAGSLTGKPGILIKGPDSHNKTCSKYVIRVYKIFSTNNPPLSDFIAQDSVGVQIEDCKSIFVDLQYVANFTTGLRLYGNTSGVANNIINIECIYCSYYGIHFLKTENGWVNENTIIKPQIRNSSAFSNLMGNNIAIVFEKNGEDTHMYNNNTIIDPCVEGAGTGIMTKGCGVYYSRILNLRHEGVSTLIDEDADTTIVSPERKCLVSVYTPSLRDYKIGQVHKTFNVKSDNVDFPSFFGNIKYLRTNDQVSFSSGQVFTIDNDYVKVYNDFVYCEGALRNGMNNVVEPINIRVPKSRNVSFAVKRKFLYDTVKEGDIYITDGKVVAMPLGFNGSTSVNLNGVITDGDLLRSSDNIKGISLKRDLRRDYAIYQTSIFNIPNDVEFLTLAMSGMSYDYEIIKYSDFDIIENKTDVYKINDIPIDSNIRDNVIGKFEGFIADIENIGLSTYNGNSWSGIWQTIATGKTSGDTVSILFPSAGTIISIRNTPRGGDACVYVGNNDLNVLFTQDLKWDIVRDIVDNELYIKFTCTDSGHTNNKLEYKIK